MSDGAATALMALGEPEGGEDQAAEGEERQAREGRGGRHDRDLAFVLPEGRGRGRRSGAALAC